MRLLPFVPMLTVAIGCSADAEIQKPLCDPLNPAAGRVAIEARSVGGLADGAAVLYDNGAPFLFVDGQCNYWVNDPWQIWNETRSGVLDADTAADLGARLHFGAWPDLAGTWSDPRGGVFDAPVLIFDDSTAAVVCLDLCDHPDVPAAVKAMRDELSVVTKELWERGSPVASSVRAIAVRNDPASHVPWVDWPLTRPISDFVRSGTIEYGEGVLEEDTASVQALEELRASFLRGDHGQFFWNMLPVESDGAYYRLYLRDTLPFEDERGLVPLSL